MNSKNKLFTKKFLPSENEMTAIVRGLYLSILGREPDAPGLAYWVQLWRTEAGDLASIAANLLASPEYQSKTTAGHNDSSRVQDCLPAELAHSPVVVVDVGAQNLANEDHAYAALDKYDVPYRVIGFEPLEHRRQERMEKNQPQVSLLPAFIGDGKAHTFYINNPDATSSLLPFNRTVTEKLLELSPLKTVATESAHTSTLDATLEQEPYIDFLKLDIQGFELPALQHATLVLQRTLVVHCEVSFVEIYQGQALFSEVEQHMRDAGFDLVDFSTLCRYPFVGTPHLSSRDWLGWGDAVFFRRLPTGASWRERLVQSVIALYIYKKPSLAAWLARDLRDTPAKNFFNAMNNPNSF